MKARRVQQHFGTSGDNWGDSEISTKYGDIEEEADLREIWGVKLRFVEQEHIEA